MSIRRAGFPFLALLALAAVGASEAHGTPADRLTRHAAQDRAPDWSPDGGAIVFASDREGQWDLYTVDPETGATARLTESAANERYPVWSPSGDRVLYLSDRDDRTDLWVLDLASRATERLTDDASEETPADWTPDGLGIVFAVAPPEIGGPWRIETLDLESRERRTLLVERYRALWPRFDGDGGALAFFSRRDTGGEDDEIYLLEGETGSPRRLFEKAGHDFCPAWSPDGRRLAFASIEGDSRFIAVIDRSGGTPRRLTADFERATEPSWSPDGRRVAFAGRRDGNYDVYVVPAAP